MSQKPRKRARRSTVEDPAAPVDPIAQSLAAHGERFLQMFYDSGDELPTPAAPGRAPPATPSRATPLPHTATSGDDGGASSSDESDSEAGSSDGDGSSDSSVASGSSQEGAGPGPTGPEEFVFGGKSVVRSSRKHGSSSGCNLAGPRRALASPARRQKQDRKHFMSHKAGAVHGSAAADAAAAAAAWPSPRSRARAAAGAAGGVAATTRAGFLAMQREVQLYGATGLDKKAKQRFEAQALAKLGAKAAKGPRIPASIGLGMAKKQAKRDARALEEGIAAGMIKAKGLGKKKRAEKSANLDRGLNEDGGSFRPGVMRVRAGVAGRKK